MELVDVRAEAVAPGESICINGAVVLVTAVDVASRAVDLHTEYGPALRLTRGDWIALAVTAEQVDAA